MFQHLDCDDHHLHTVTYNQTVICPFCANFKLLTLHCALCQMETAKEILSNSYKNVTCVTKG